MKTLHEPPTADPHGGWCGGWGLEASGYPIRAHLGVVQVLLFHSGTDPKRGSFCAPARVSFRICMSLSVPLSEVPREPSATDRGKNEPKSRSREEV